MSTSINATPRISPVAEMKQSLAEFVAWCRAQRGFSALFWGSVHKKIADDIATSQQAAKDQVYAAEQYDLTADKELADALAALIDALGDGVLNEHDLPKVHSAVSRLKAARKHVQRSASCDHTASEMLTA